MRLFPNLTSLTVGQCPRLSAGKTLAAIATVDFPLCDLRISGTVEEDEQILHHFAQGVLLVHSQLGALKVNSKTIRIGEAPRQAN